MNKILLLLVLVSFSFASINIDNSSSFFDKFDVSFYEDSSNNLGIKDIQKIDNFKKANNRISLGYSKSSFWFIFDIENTKDEKFEYYVQFIESITEEIDLYVLRDDYSIDEYRSGLSRYETEKAITPKFRIELNSKEKVRVYIRIYSSGSIYNSFVVSSLSKLDSWQNTKNVLYSFYFGATVTLILYNLFLFLYTRDILYRDYIIYVSSFIFWHLMLNTFLPFDYIGLWMIPYLQEFVGMMIGLSIVFFINFSRSILDTKHILPKIDIYLLYSQYILVFLALFIFINMRLSLEVMNVIANLTTPVLLWIAYRCYKNGNKISLFYIIAQGVFLSGATFYSLLASGFIEYNTFTRHAVVLTSLVEMVLFSLALAYKIKSLENDKFELVKNINKELEDKITIRTKELIIAKDEAMRNSKIKSEFLANMSHEIRTPLNGIIGLIHLIRQESLTKKVSSLSQKVEYSAKNLLGIVNDILDFSKIEANKIVLDKVEFNLKEIIDNIIYMFESMAKEKEIYLKVNIELNVSKQLYGDSLRISQIIINLLSNAIKFTSKGGVVLDISRVSKDRYKFNIKDTGIGLSQEQINNLFDSFVQADSSTTRKYGGTGLGLSISKKLVELMNGKIWVESTKGVGSSFIFEVDLLDVESKCMEDKYINSVENSIEELINCTKSILVVEDNEINQIVISGILDKVNIKYHIASNGKEAIDFYKNNKYDLILMDILMPVMDGLEASKIIKQIDSKIPIIALSANATTEDTKKIKDAGMNEHLTKPIQVEKLYKVLKEYLIQESIEEVKSLDIKLGMAYHMDNNELYIKSLKNFEKKYKKIDLHDYEILHDLKSVSQMIGAVKLNNICQSIDNDLDNIDELKIELESVMANIEDFFK
jgi:signal transduction histidine kinase/DNA-binding response OmpR family regulator